MVQKAVYFSIIYMFITPTLIYYGRLPNFANWIGEVMAILFIPVILISLALNKKFYAPTRYLVLIVLTFFMVGISFVYNQSDASALILGLRHHFTYLPFFMLPLVHDFTENQIKKILWLICALLLLQTPVSLLQRFVIFPHLNTGDVVRGTLGTSGFLSILLIFGISVLYSLFLAKHITLLKFIILSAFLFFPTMINETKATFVMLPISLGISTLLFGDKNIFLKLKKIGTYAIVVIVFAFFFNQIYIKLYTEKRADIVPPIEHFQKEIEGRGYLYYGDKATERVEAGYYVGRLDTIMFAIKNISQDSGRFIFGIGIGNAISTKISFLETGNKDIEKLKPDNTTMSNVLWEMGISGIFIQLVFLSFIFKDAFRFSGYKNFISAFCLGWCSIIAIYVITLFYVNILHGKHVYVPFFLLSGIVVSKSYQHMQDILSSSSKQEVYHKLNEPPFVSPVHIKT